MCLAACRSLVSLAHETTVVTLLELGAHVSRVRDCTFFGSMFRAWADPLQGPRKRRSFLDSSHWGVRGVAPHHTPDPGTGVQSTARRPVMGVDLQLQCHSRNGVRHRTSWRSCSRLVAKRACELVRAHRRGARTWNGCSSARPPPCDATISSPLVKLQSVAWSCPCRAVSCLGRPRAARSVATMIDS